jgi:hypothetical protein
MGQEEEAAIGRERASGERDGDGLLGKERKVPREVRIVLGGMVPFLACSRMLNQLYTKKAKRPSFHWGLH